MLRYLLLPPPPFQNQEQPKSEENLAPELFSAEPFTLFSLFSYHLSQLSFSASLLKGKARAGLRRERDPRQDKSGGNEIGGEASRLL